MIYLLLWRAKERLYVLASDPMQCDTRLRFQSMRCGADLFHKKSRPAVVGGQNPCEESSCGGLRGAHTQVSAPQGHLAVSR